MTSSDSDDDFAAYGTPLEPLEEDEIPKKKPCLIEDQIVTDKNGRRRFHGAFTGGFSAGFFNTVGSLEGWTPSSFKSSKSEKQTIAQQKPEDFMDEEDFGEFGIAPVILKARKDYSNDNTKSHNVMFNQNLGKFVLKDLLKPVRETIGVKLLKRMGWKPGQGVGPRLTSNEKKKMSKIRERVYGCQLPPITKEKGSHSDTDSETENVEFAPEDFELFFDRPQENFFGMGYQGLDKRPILASKKPSYLLKESHLKFKSGSQAFGVGAFEEEDDDVYAKDDMSRYDYSLGNDSQLLQNSAKLEISDSHEILEGFVMAIKKKPQKCYPIPVVPNNFKPFFHFQNLKSKSTSIKNKRSRWDQTNLKNEDTPQEKSNISTSVMEKSEHDRKVTEELIVNVSVNQSRFKPFANSIDKQSRYEKYLKLVQIQKPDLLKNLQPISMTDWDKEREKLEFEKAALLFKPLTGVMEDRFLTASQPDDLSDPLAVVEKFQNEKNDRKKAVQMNMYGKLTREIQEWTPNPLLCKRFNIPDPEKSRIPSLEERVPKTTKLASIFDLLNDKIHKSDAEKTDPIEKISRPFEDLKESREKDVKVTDSSEQILEGCENKIDLFKAIFLDSDEDCDSGECSSKSDLSKEKTETNLQNNLLFEEKIINLKRNSSPASGIFKGIDLDSLSKQSSSTSQYDNKTELEKDTVVDPNQILDLMYGPKMPDRIVTITKSTTFEEVSKHSCWVEKEKSNKSKKRKEKKHKKSSKSKHKHKKSRK